MLLLNLSANIEAVQQLTQFQSELRIVDNRNRTYCRETRNNKRKNCKPTYHPSIIAYVQLPSPRNSIPPLATRFPTKSST